MNRRVSFRPQAEAEALDTRDWYESRRQGLGAEFRAALNETIDRIVTNPLMYRRVRGETRRAPPCTLNGLSFTSQNCCRERAHQLQPAVSSSGFGFATALSERLT